MSAAHPLPTNRRTTNGRRRRATGTVSDALALWVSGDDGRCCVLVVGGTAQSEWGRERSRDRNKAVRTATRSGGPMLAVSSRRVQPVIEVGGDRRGAVRGWQGRRAVV